MKVSKVEQAKRDKTLTKTVKEIKFNIGDNKLEGEFDLPFGMSGVNIPYWSDLEEFKFKGSDEIEITIGLSCWNRDGTIKQCIDSIVNQSFPKENWELIIVDDASEDNSQDLIYKTIYKYKDYNILYYPLEESVTKNEHFPHNVGIRKANGKIFLKLSADTLISKNYLEGVYRHHSRGSNLFLHCFWGAPVDRPRNEKLINYIVEETDLEEEKLSKFIVPELPDAHNGKHAIDTGASMLTKHWRSLGGFDERIVGNTPGDVCLMCRASNAGIIYGYDPSMYMVHSHITTKDTKRGFVGPDVKWEPKVIEKNNGKYGLLSEKEENRATRLGHFNCRT